MVESWSPTVLCSPTAHGHRSPAPDMAMYDQYWTDHQTLIWPFFGHRWTFLVMDGPPLALPGSVLTPSTSPRPGLDRPTSDNDLFDSIFHEKIENCHFLDPFGPSFTPLEIKIWPRDYHRKIRHEKLRRIHISNVSNRPLDPILWSNLWSFFDLFLGLSSRCPRPLCIWPYIYGHIYGHI